MTAERIRVQTGIDRLPDGRWRPLVRLTRQGQPPDEIHGDVCPTEADAERVARATAREVRSRFGL